MIYSKKNSLFESIFAVYLKRLMRNHFHKIHLSDGRIIDKSPLSIPTIIYANHSNWWDGFVAFYLARFVFRIDSYLMMDIEQMKKYKQFKRLGVFSVDKNSAKETMEAINHAAELLAGKNRYLWIFPQGEMLPNNSRPLKFQKGAAVIASKLGRVNLVPMALKYEFVSEQRPEIFIRFGETEIVDSGSINKDKLTEKMRQKLTILLDKLDSDIASYSINDFKTIFTGKESRNKTVDRISGAI